jgi:hypothetical protein
MKEEGGRKKEEERKEEERKKVGPASARAYGEKSCELAD